MDIVADIATAGTHFAVGMALATTAAAAAELLSEGAGRLRNARRERAEAELDRRRAELRAAVLHLADALAEERIAAERAARDVGSALGRSADRRADRA